MPTESKLAAGALEPTSKPLRDDEDMEEYVALEGTPEELTTKGKYIIIQCFD